MKKVMLVGIVFVLGFLVGCTSETTTTDISTYTLSYFELIDQTTMGTFILDEDQLLTHIELGDAHGLAVINDNRLIAWGNNERGQLGNNTTDSSTNPIDITSFLNLEVDETIDMIASGHYHSLLLTSNGRLLVWGWNVYGQLGDGTANQRNVPTDMTDGLNLNLDEFIVKIVAGSDYSGLVTSEGRVFMWGRNQLGQLGDGSINDSQIPIEITSQFELDPLEVVIDLYAGMYHSMAVTSDHHLYSWGGNAYGQLGNGTNALTIHPTDISSNVPLSTQETILKVMLGEYFTALLTSEGTVFTWGSNDWGQLGNGSSSQSWTPVNITDTINLEEEESIVDIAVGPTYMFALTSQNRLFGWGKNSRGQLGDGTTFHHDLPEVVMEEITADENNLVSQIASGVDFSMILLSSGEVFGWGYNDENQLSLSGETSYYDPQAIAVSGIISRMLKTETYDYQSNLTEYTPTKEGYTFSGWYVDNTLLIPFTATTMPNQNVNLYGRWLPTI